MRRSSNSSKQSAVSGRQYYWLLPTAYCRLWSIRVTPSPIFIITGTPGSGKSSVAAALMRRFEFGLHIPVDNLRELVVSGIAHPVPEWTDETSRQFMLARRAAAGMARLYAEAGFAVAIDDVIFPAEARDLLSGTLDGLAIHQVLLYPSLDVALERSTTRTNKDFDAAVLDTTIRELHRAIGEQPVSAVRLAGGRQWPANRGGDSRRDTCACGGAAPDLPRGRQARRAG
jgi:chloramphenicol 3-O-phosphotransferase